MDLEDQFICGIRNKIEEPRDKIEESRDKIEEPRNKIKELTRTKPCARLLQKLPVEILLEILSDLPDVKSLRAAVHSCSRLLSVWNENRPQIISNHVGMSHGVLREAASAAGFPVAPIEHARIYWVRSGRYRSAPFDIDACVSIYSSLSFIGNRNQNDPISCDLEDARRLEGLQPVVRKLADIYIRQCGATNTALSGALDERRVTRLERVRIERAFYRYETFCRTFGSFDGRHGQRSWRPDAATLEARDPGWLDDPVPVFVQEFKQSFDTVELIQLQCIYGFLKRLVTPVVNDLLWHIGDWLSETRLVEYWATDDRVAPHVLAGLEHVNDIWAAFTRRDTVGLVDLMQEGKLFVPLQRMRDTALYQVLCAEFNMARKASIEVTRNKIGVHDTDSSPHDACLAVAPSIFDMGEYTEDKLRKETDRLSQCRKWGFVFWDRQRLDMMGFFEHPGLALETKDFFLSNDRNATARIYERQLRELAMSRRASQFVYAEWMGPFDQPEPIEPRFYNAWYPLASPELHDVAKDL
ncbi:hypothetical protein Daus18300_009473 [Diaporthe australafricana]|uniref:F-box domain-containing protein n=1 Tax=Diaporthe australafricana TaxID=127596 RepID=A0ABR3WEI0_9PEZI